MRQTFDLNTDDFARVRGMTCLRVMQGRVWVTIDGEPDDHLLDAGDALALPARGKVLAQALDTPARLTVHRAAPWWQPLADAWQVATRRGALA